MGDIFHSNPVVVNPPADFELFTKDLYWRQRRCAADDLDQTRGRGRRSPTPGSRTRTSAGASCWRWARTTASSTSSTAASSATITSLDDPTTPDDEAVIADCLLNVPATSSSRLAGLFDDDSQAGDFDNGTGRELFSFIPQQMMPLIKELSEIDELTTQYGVDGTTRSPMSSSIRWCLPTTR
jgi:hypothetical protein